MPTTTNLFPSVGFRKPTRATGYCRFFKNPQEMREFLVDEMRNARGKRF